MVPELAEYLSEHIYDEVLLALDEYLTIAPYWFVSKIENEFAEGTIRNLYDYHTLFMAQAWILNVPYEQLAKFIDIPAVKRGDLSFIDNLVSAIES
jgi:hypothetical protein